MTTNLKKTETLVKAIAPIIKQHVAETYEKRSQQLYKDIKAEMEVMWMDIADFKSEQPEFTKEDILAMTRKEMENFEIDVPIEAFDESKTFVIDYVKALKDELDG